MTASAAGAIALGFAAIVALPCAIAEETGFRKNVGDYALYLAVMPAALIRGPAARDTHQVMVSIFDSRSGLRVSGLQVKARVAAPGFYGEKRDLEPISVGGATVYGKAFPMLGRGPFRVDVEFSTRYGPHAQQATFYFTHPSFAAPK